MHDVGGVRYITSVFHARHLQIQPHWTIWNPCVRIDFVICSAGKNFIWLLLDIPFLLSGRTSAYFLYKQMCLKQQNVHNNKSYKELAVNKTESHLRLHCFTA